MKQLITPLTTQQLATLNEHKICELCYHNPAIGLIWISTMRYASTCHECAQKYDIYIESHHATPNIGQFANGTPSPIPLRDLADRTEGLLFSIGWSTAPSTAERMHSNRPSTPVKPKKKPRKAVTPEAVEARRVHETNRQKNLAKKQAREQAARDVALKALMVGTLDEKPVANEPSMPSWYKPEQHEADPATNHVTHGFARHSNQSMGKPLTFLVIRRIDKICRYCLMRPATTVDHIMPISRGGTDTWLNLVGCCLICNQLKADKTPKEAGMVLHMPLRMFYHAPHRSVAGPPR